MLGRTRPVKKPNANHQSSRPTTTRGLATPRDTLVCLGWSLVLGWLLTVAPVAGQAPSTDASAAGPLFADVDLLVLTGLPGDVESESTYRRQVGRLLETLERRGWRPKRAWVVSDEGESLDLPEVPWPVVRVAASRSEFRALVSELEGSATPLVVMAWGHGGTVRDTPVLHVRGPRLEPADFASLATAVSAPSRWLLFFRHSGGFARGLREVGGEVLASEHRTAFRSDPVAVDRWLEALADESAGDFESLAHSLARRTLDWYDGQHLMRQEEPTLWRSQGPAVVLAEVVTSEPVTLEDRTDAPSADPAVADADSPPTVEDGGVASGVWRDFEPVDPADYPGADAVVLERRYRYTLGDDPAFVLERDELIQILRPAGTRRGDIALSYSPPGETFDLVDGEVRHPDGRVVRVAPEDVRDATGEALAGYRVPTTKLIYLPDVVVGSVLRIHTRGTWRRFPLPHVLFDVALAGPDPVRRMEVRIEVDRESPFHWRLAGASGEPAVVERPYGIERTWSFENLPAWPDEPLSSPLAVPQLQVSTFPSWDEFGAWYRRLVREADNITPEIAAKAAELAADHDDPREVVRSIYEWVTSLRYVAIPLGVNSHRPHAAERVFDNRYGDCKDKANLFNTMLASLGYEADLVLVPRFGQAYDALPGAGFNHAISRVQLGDEVIWADTTDEVARFGLLPPGDPGRRVLVIEEGIDTLDRLPAPKAQDHRLLLRGRIEVSRPGAEDSPVELEAEAWGYPDYALRFAAHQGVAGPLIRSYLSPVVGLFSLDRQEASDPGDLATDFSWRAEGRLSGLQAGGGDLESGATRHWIQAPLWWPEEWEAALHRRQTPLLLNQGYPLRLTQELDLELPPGARIRESPEPRQGGEGPLRWQLEWQPLEGRRASAGERAGWRVRLEIELATGELDATATEIFQRQARLLRGALGRGAWYEL